MNFSGVFSFNKHHFITLVALILGNILFSGIKKLVDQKKSFPIRTVINQKKKKKTTCKRQKIANFRTQNLSFSSQRFFDLPVRTFKLPVSLHKKALRDHLFLEFLKPSDQENGNNDRCLSPLYLLHLPLRFPQFFTQFLSKKRMGDPVRCRS